MTETKEQAGEQHPTPVRQASKFPTLPGKSLVMVITETLRSSAISTPGPGRGVSLI
jgi:hypothetical protein